MTDEELDRRLELFCITKEVGCGTGLGLSISQGLVKEFYGWIEVTSNGSHGSIFRILIPVMGGQNEREGQTPYS